MRIARNALLVAAFAVPLLFLHYHLPFSDVVRIVGTEVVRLGGEPAGEAGPTSEDVRYINAVTRDGDPRVYRNEDTGWGWPPYFKFSSADLSAEAESAASPENPRWFLVTSYGWRIPILSRFPNAIRIEPAPASGLAGWPWVASVTLAVAFALLLWLWRKAAKSMSRTGSSSESRSAAASARAATSERGANAEDPI